MLKLLSKKDETGEKNIFKEENWSFFASKRLFINKSFTMCKKNFSLVNYFLYFKDNFFNISVPFSDEHLHFLCICNLFCPVETCREKKQKTAVLSQYYLHNAI